jgi:hypothetical protein
VATVQTLSSPLVITAAEPATQAGQEIMVAEGQKLRFALDVVSPQAGPLHCIWLLNGQEQAQGRTWTYQPQFDEGGPTLKDVTGRITDGANHMAERRWRVRVREVNRPPTITAAFPPAETLEIAAGEEQPFAVEAADPDTGDRLAYLWVLDGRQVARGPRWRFRVPSTPTARTHHLLTVKVSDTRGLEQRRGWNLVAKRPLLPPQVMETQPPEVVVLPSLRLSEGGDAEERRKEQEARTQLAQRGVSWSGTALIESAAKGDTRAVELFLTAGMSPNAQDESGGTPLMAAGHDRPHRASTGLARPGRGRGGERCRGVDGLDVRCLDRPHRRRAGLAARRGRRQCNQQCGGDGLDGSGTSRRPQDRAPAQASGRSGVRGSASSCKKGGGLHGHQARFCRKL